MFQIKQRYFLLCMFLLLCSLTGCSKASPAETNITSPIPATEIASTPSSMDAEGNSATPIPQWLRINEQSLELDSEADSESKIFVRGFWYDKSDQGDYEFHMEKVKRKSETEEIVKSVAGNYAELHYDKKTKCLTIRGTGEMFYDDFKMGLDDKVSDGEERWESVSLPIDPEKVTTIIVENGITEVSRFAFGGFKNLKTIILPETIKTIKAFAFYGCEQLETICIPDNTEQIGRECFFDCESLKEISIGKKLKKIGKGNFGSCKSLKSIKVSKENKYFTTQDGILYGESDKTAYFAFHNKRHVVIRKGTKKIGDFSFFYNHLKTVQIPASVEKISGGAFFNCNNLQKVTFEKNSKCKTFGRYKVPLFEIDWYVSPFMYCDKLINIILPDKLKDLNGGFEGCKSLQKIYIGKSLCGKKGDILFEEFKNSSNRYYIVSPENPWYSSRNGKLYNKAGTKLLDDPAAKKKRNEETDDISIRELPE